MNEVFLDTSFAIAIQHFAGQSGTIGG